MSFKDYAEKSKQYLSQLTKYLTGDSSAPNLDIDIDLSIELNALHNVSTAEQLIELSNGFYDQVAFKRSLIEIYKKPKDYLAEYTENILVRTNSLNSLDSSIDNQLDSVAKNKQKSQSIKSISNKLQLKLSLIKDNSNA